MHGNRNGPEALVEAAKVAAQWAPVAIGLEAPEEETEIFQNFMNSEGSAADRDALLGARFWSPTFFDGRANAALVEALEILRRLRADGADVTVFGFVRMGEHDPLDQNPHEQRMADVIVEQASKSPDGKIVVLVGNLHAQTVEFQFGDAASVTPMAVRIAAAIDETVTIKLVYGGGSTWARTPEGLRRLDLTPQGEVLTEFAIDKSATFHALWPVGEGVPSPPAHPDTNLPG